MKSRKKLVAIVLGISVIFSSVLMTTGMATTNSANNNSSVVATADGNFNDIILSPGADSTQLNFAWYSSNSKATPMVQVALKSDVTGTDFPASKAQTFKGQTSIGNSGFTSNKVSTSGYKQSSQYVYRLGDGTNWSPSYNYNTYSNSTYSFLFAGDPQIGAGGDITKDSAGWADTLNKATNLFNDNSFMISVGDQVNNGTELNGASNELEYSGYFAPQQLKSLPVAAIAGNHETYGPGHKTHFNAPNLSDKYGTFDAGTAGGTDSGTDYYFTYNNTLYMMLNSNDMNEGEHKQFMQDAISKNPNATWKVVVLHHSVYSSANHETDADIVQRRNDLPPIFDSLGIDVVLDGHDHCYTRTYQMKGGQPIKTQNVDSKGRVINATGTLYITANSASGSKYYEIGIPGTNNYYEAKKEQIHVPTFSRVTITSDSFTITTYRTDTMAQTDSYTLVKSNSSVQTVQDVINKINNLPESGSITIKDATNIKNARTAYTALSASEQKLVTNLSKLVADEKKIAGIEAVSLSSSKPVVAKPTSSVKTLPKTGQFVDESVLMALGLILVVTGSSVIIINKKRKRL